MYSVSASDEAEDESCELNNISLIFCDDDHRPFSLGQHHLKYMMSDLFCNLGLISNIILLSGKYNYKNICFFYNKCDVLSSQARRNKFIWKVWLDFLLVMPDTT